jgi:hypothetical protein
MGSITRKVARSLSCTVNVMHLGSAVVSKTSSVSSRVSCHSGTFLPFPRTCLIFRLAQDQLRSPLICFSVIAKPKAIIVCTLGCSDSGTR